MPAVEDIKNTTETIISNTFTATIVSFLPFKIDEYKPGLIPGRFKIEASDGKTPSVLHVGDSKHMVYLDSTRGYLPVIDPVNMIAESICRDFIDGQLQVTKEIRPAIFWIPGKLTAQEVLSKHENLCKYHLGMQKSWFAACCKMADDDWKRYQKHNVVSDNQRIFASAIGLKAADHPWMVIDEIAGSKECIKCFTKLDPRATVCHACRSEQTIKENKN